MADGPILFSAPMVRAILREIEQPGTGKTQTRRAVEDVNLPHLHRDDDLVLRQGGGLGTRTYRFRRRHRVGDRLYVREAWHAARILDSTPPREIPHDADIEHAATARSYAEIGLKGKFRQGMHMPRWASRLTLIVTDVRVQPLQEIDEDDAVAEGVERLHEGFFPYGITTFMTTVVDGREVPAQYCRTARDSFHMLWDSLNAERDHGWDTNPWVVAYTFRPILGNIDQVAHA